MIFGLGGGKAIDTAKGAAESVETVCNLPGENNYCNSADRSVCESDRSMSHMGTSPNGLMWAKWGQATLGPGPIGLPH